MKKTLTDRQRAILEFIKNQIAINGYPPTIREIGKQFAISSTNGVRTHLNALIKKKYIRKNNFISRGLELVQPLANNIGRIPLVGTVPAGQPIDAVENVEGELALDLSFLPKGDSFSLKVVGDSMKNAGILDGDLVLVRKQSIAQKGDIVVAIIGSEATVKRFSHDGRQIRLQPENDDFDAIIVDKHSRDFRIAGKVVGLLRKMG